MPLTQTERDEIIRIAIEGTKGDLVDEIAKRTVLSSAEVQKVLSGIDKIALAQTVAVVTKATSSNASKAVAIQNISGGVEALVKIASLLL